MVPSPNVGTTYNYLNGVAAVSSNDIWAVGVSSGPYQMLIEHWDGSEWSVVPSPPVGGEGLSWLNAVTAISSNDVWAVGDYYNFPGDDTLTIHWDGTEWSVVPSPNVGTGTNDLKGVSAISSNDVWAVGYYHLEPAGGYYALIEHWDGTAWSVVPSPDPNPGAHPLVLNAVAAISSNDVWAVGYYSPYSTGALLEHWDGDEWSVAPGPEVTVGYNILQAVAAVASDDVWAVGSSSDGTLIERYRHIACPPPPDPPRCPTERFTDVCPTDYFYPHVLDLNDLHILSGYNTTPPCDGPAHIPCFKPYNWSTRGQIAKVVSLAAGLSEPVSGQTFEDVPPAHTFYQYIERMASRNIINGYPCGGAAEPCGPDNLPYFRPGNSVGRGQLSKMAALAFGFNEPVTTQTFQDAPPGYIFYEHIERLAVRAIISGYPCGEPGEPCIPPYNRPYFRPANQISRGQIAKIVNLARIQAISTPTPTATYTYTPTPNSLTTTPTGTATPEATSTIGISTD